MIEKIIYYVFFTFFMIIQDYGIWYSIIKHMCKKVKGDCTKCNEWSCFRQNYLDEKGNLKDVSK